MELWEECRFLSLKISEIQLETAGVRFLIQMTIIYSKKLILGGILNNYSSKFQMTDLVKASGHGPETLLQ